MRQIISSQKKLKSGYTTGTCASAAAYAALYRLIRGDVLQQVEVDLPGMAGLRYRLRGYRYDGGSVAEVIKDAVMTRIYSVA